VWSCPRERAVHQQADEWRSTCRVSCDRVSCGAARCRQCGENGRRHARQPSEAASHCLTLSPRLRTTAANRAETRVCGGVAVTAECGARRVSRNSCHATSASGPHGRRARGSSRLTRDALDDTGHTTPSSRLSVRGALGLSGRPSAELGCWTQPDTSPAAARQLHLLTTTAQRAHGEHDRATMRTPS
jgi:hypothetical protein